MKKTVAKLLLSITLIGTIAQSCKDAPNKETSTPITKDIGTSVMIENTMQKKEWEQFKISIDSTININDIQIAELKIKMQKTKKTADSSAILQIKVLVDKNQAIKTKLNTYVNQTTKNWDTFKIGINHDLKDFAITLNQYTTENKK
jgi:hypothetical protein